MLRPLLAFAAADAAGADPRGALPAAQVIELMHAASLIHDDLIDEADCRRGRPAMHIRLGSAGAIVAGDVLLLSAFDTIATADVPAARVSTALRELTGHAIACCRGQAAELDAGARPLRVADYLGLVCDKTAGPFVAAAALGAIMAGADEEHVAVLRTYARAVGVAFQIRDDVLDAAADRESGRAPLPWPELEAMEVARARVAEAVAAAAALPGRAAGRVLCDVARFAVERDR